MGETKEPAKVFGQYTAADDAAFEAAAAKIVTDDPKPAPEIFDLGQDHQEAPEVQAQEVESEVDAEAIEEARDAYRRDRLSDDEIEARLGKLGHKQFVQRGQKRAKKHREDDEAYAELRRLRATEDSPKGTTPVGKGERSQAGTPTLNLQEVAAPLAERLGLDSEGLKALIAYGEAAVKSKDTEIGSLRENMSLLASVMNDNLLEGARKSVGLDQVDDEDWFRIQRSYEALLRTDRHGELTGKPRMNALLRDAAMLEGVKGADPAEIQRQASIASAKRNGAPVVQTARRMPDKKMNRDEIFDHVASLVTSGKFKGQPASVVRDYADRLRARNK